MSREPNIHGSAETRHQRLNEYFIPGYGIDRKVICADICRYLGNDALVRPGTYKENEGRLIQGYYISAYRNLTSNNIRELKEDSARWEDLQKESKDLGNRLYYPGSEALGYPPRSPEAPDYLPPQYPEPVRPKAPHGPPPSLYSQSGNISAFWASRNPGQLNVPRPTEEAGWLNAGGSDVADAAPAEPKKAQHAASVFSGDPDSGYASASQYNPSVAAKQVEQARTTQDLGSDCHDEQDREDLTTEYSTASYLDDDRFGIYKDELADHLSHRVDTLDLDTETRKQLADALPNLLKQFAVRMGQGSTRKPEREVMFFIHKHRNEIAQRFRKAVAISVDEDVSPARTEPRKAEEVSLRVTRWLEDVSGGHEDAAPLTSELDTLNLVGGDGQSQEPCLPERDGYREIVFNCPAFKWLLASLGREVLLSPINAESIARLRVQMIRLLPPVRNISTRAPPESYWIEFSLDCDLRAFMLEQYRSPGERSQLARIITLTGSAANVQAMTSEEYMKQVWPYMGIAVLDVVQTALSTDACASREFTDRTIVKVNVLESTFTVDAYGTPDIIADIGESAAWLASALQPSKHDARPTYCSPTIKSTSSHRHTLKVHVEIDVHHDRENISVPNGMCWQTMFRNPVIVTGFPITKRPCIDSGLEMPLNMMAGIIQSKRVHTFMGRAFLKGFSSMLVLVGHIGGVYIWHHHYMPDGRRISYCDADDSTVEGVTLQALETSRHIVGWCTEARYMAGARGMNYAVKSSGLPWASRDFRLEKLSFSCGQIVTGGCSFNIGKRDTPIHISREGYVAKLRWIAQKHFVLWDEDDKRGWLINGMGALLHLLRASLEFSRTDKFKSTFLFDFAEFRDSSDLQFDSAIKILLDRNNRTLPVYPAKEETCTEKTTRQDGTTETVTKTTTTYTSLESKVEELYECLEIMIEHKSSLDNSGGLDAKVRLRKHLEGWDFRDLAANRDPFHLRVATLPPAAFSWVELTRSIQAVALFGKGFGDLLRPATTGLTHRVRSCSTWQSVPKGKYYLCAGVADLCDIVQEAGGDLSTNPITISSRLVWQNPSGNRDPFEACPCTRQPPHHNHPHPVQQILLSRWSKVLPKGPIALSNCERGAVIFGQTIGFRFMWPESGDHVGVNIDDTTQGLEVTSMDATVRRDILADIPEGSENVAPSKGQSLFPPSAASNTSESACTTSDQTVASLSPSPPLTPLKSSLAISGEVCLPDHLALGRCGRQLPSIVEPS